MVEVSLVVDDVDSFMRASVVDVEPAMSWAEAGAATSTSSARAASTGASHRTITHFDRTVRR